MVRSAILSLIWTPCQSLSQEDGVFREIIVLVSLPSPSSYLKLPQAPQATIFLHFPLLYVYCYYYLYDQLLKYIYIYCTETVSILLFLYSQPFVIYRYHVYKYYDHSFYQIFLVKGKQRVSFGVHNWWPIMFRNV